MEALRPSPPQRPPAALTAPSGALQRLVLCEGGVQRVVQDLALPPFNQKLVTGVKVASPSPPFEKENKPLEPVAGSQRVQLLESFRLKSYFEPNK